MGNKMSPRPSKAMVKFMLQRHLNWRILQKIGHRVLILIYSATGNNMRPRPSRSHNQWDKEQKVTIAFKVRGEGQSKCTKINKG